MTQKPTIQTAKEEINAWCESAPERAIAQSNPASGPKTNIEPYLEEEKDIDPEFREMMWGLHQVWLKKSDNR